MMLKIKRVLLRCDKSVKLSIAFAFTMLALSWQLAGSESANIVLLFLISLYVMVTGFIGNEKKPIKEE